jgi:hypothetical protein
MRSDRDSETLVYLFGATPLVTETLIEAQHLAYWFQTNDPFGSLRWSKVSPDSPYLLCQAIRFADQRARGLGMTISWDDLWAYSAHSKRMKRGDAKYRNGKLRLPVLVRLALGTAFAP